MVQNDSERFYKHEPVMTPNGQEAIVTGKQDARGNYEVRYSDGSTEFLAAEQLESQP